MPGNTFGQALRVTTAGESHGPGELVIVDGCPPGLTLTPEDFRRDMARRRPGQSALTTPRHEDDVPELISGIFEGRTTGAPIGIYIRNQDARSKDYEALRDVYRPGHADLAYDQKYGVRDHRGGGRASARETVTRVAAGVIAKKLLLEAAGTQVLGYVVGVGTLRFEHPDPSAVTLAEVEANAVRCPDPTMAMAMTELIEEARRAGDSLGSVVELVAHPVPVGLGEPVFDKLKADLGKALFSLPAVVGVEYGAGFRLAQSRGSAANDPLTVKDGQVRPGSNRHGGILGGISTGLPIVLRAGLKPTSSIPLVQETVTKEGELTTLRVGGRHDPCLGPRFVPMAEAMIALTLADHLLRHRAQNGAWR
ncbi:MAG: chorismate synthase [Deltaproteobacteria bacterium]|jgi:chorismate synthase|nr:chorismate synthase [Deltaproteobacteria bacterium]